MNFADKCHDLNQRSICNADCCGPMPMERQFFMEHYGNIEPNIGYLLGSVPESTAVIPLTDDAMCIFLDRTKRSCRIYNDRPEVCKRFGDESHPLLFCPHMDAQGKERNRQQRRKLQRKLSKAMDSYMKRQKPGENR